VTKENECNTLIAKPAGRRLIRSVDVSVRIILNYKLEERFKVDWNELRQNK
jgi:hypothetical protein